MTTAAQLRDTLTVYAQDISEPPKYTAEGHLTKWMTGILTSSVSIQSVYSLYTQWVYTSYTSAMYNKKQFAYVLLNFICSPL